MCVGRISLSMLSGLPTTNSRTSRTSRGNFKVHKKKDGGDGAPFLS